MNKQFLSKAMILAAGFGTRLKPLTLTIPKALVKYNEIPMIELVLNKLIASGIKEVVINTHHHSDQLEQFFKERDFTVKINLIFEKQILGTGGGIKNAAPFLKDAEHFLVHNVDILSDIDITKLYDFHIKEGAFASLSVQDRKTSRPLLIDERNYITGRVSGSEFLRYREPQGKEKPIAFCGIHVISSAIFGHFPRENFFDIFDVYFKLEGLGKKIMGHSAGKASWKDLGKYAEFEKN